MSQIPGAHNGFEELIAAQEEFASNLENHPSYLGLSMQGRLSPQIVRNGISHLRAHQADIESLQPGQTYKINKKIKAPKGILSNKKEA